MPHPFQVAIKGILHQDGRVLLLKFKKSDGAYSWDLPGGRIDNNESFEQAFTRELKEELSVTTPATLDQVLHAARAPGIFPGGNGLIWLFYTCQFELPKDPSLTEHEEILWVDQPTINHLATQKSPQLHNSFHQALIKSFATTAP